MVILPSQAFGLLANVPVVFIPKLEQGFGVVTPIVNGDVRVIPPPVALTE